MQKILIVFMLIFAGVCAYAYVTFPAGCAKLGADSSRDLGAIGQEIGTTWKSTPHDWSRVFTPLKKLVDDTAHDLAYIDSPEPVPHNDPSAANVDASASGTNVAEVVPPAWQAPPVFPAKPDWTWTTISGDEYHNVKVVGMEKNFVTVIYSGGGRRVAINNLMPDLQKELGYDTSLYAAATAQQQAAVAQTSRQVAASGKWEYEDYDQAVTQARLSGKQVLLYFTGSDWCPWCQKMDSEILTTSQFRHFAAEHFVMVTLDFPHNIPQADSLKQRNEALARKYDISGFPTLVVTDVSGRKLREAGYNPSVDQVIAGLKSP